MCASAKLHRRYAAEELAIIAGILLLILALVGSSAWAYARHRRIALVKMDLQALRRACRNFYNEYGIWPTSHAGEYGDIRYGMGVPNAEVLNILRAKDAPGNEESSVNTKRIVFLEVQQFSLGWSGLDSGGEFLDPWGTPYQLVLDTDLDGKCRIEYSIYGTRADDIAIWSCGRDGESDTEDDIVVWKQ